MASGFVYCPNCGTSSTLAGQKFCATCGATLPEVAAPAAAAAAAAAPAAAPAAWAASQPPAQPPAYGAPPAAQPPAWGAQPPAQPPAWGGPPPGSQQPWGMQAPPPKNNMLMPIVLIVGLVLILALVGVGVLLATSGKGGSGSSSAPSVVAQVSATDNTPTATPGKSTAVKTPKVTATPATADNTVTITPNTASCSGASVNLVLKWKLSGSVPGSTKIAVEFDGTVAGTSQTVSSIMTKGSDGNWTSSGHIASSDACTLLSVGDHTIGLQDDAGDILVEGTFTLTD